MVYLLRTKFKMERGEKRHSDMSFFVDSKICDINRILCRQQSLYLGLSNAVKLC